MKISLHDSLIMSTTVFEFGSFVKDFNQFTTWLKNNNLIKSEIMCAECVSVMEPLAGKRVWICSKRGQHPSGKLVKESMLKGTLFEGARTSPEMIMELCTASPSSSPMTRPRSRRQNPDRAGEAAGENTTSWRRRVLST